MFSTPWVGGWSVEWHLKLGVCGNLRAKKKFEQLFEDESVQNGYTESHWINSQIVIATTWKTEVVLHKITFKIWFPQNNCHVGEFEWYLSNLRTPLKLGSLHEDKSQTGNLYKLFWLHTIVISIVNNISRNCSVVTCDVQCEGQCITWKKILNSRNLLSSSEIKW